jgi:hypothetical protein
MRETLAPIKENFNKISDEEISKTLHEHSQKANIIAEKKVKDVYEKIGFIL